MIGRTYLPTKDAITWYGQISGTTITDTQLRHIARRDKWDRKQLRGAVYYALDHIEASAKLDKLNRERKARRGA